MKCFMKKEDKSLRDVDNVDRFATTSARRLKFVLKLSLTLHNFALLLDYRLHFIKQNNILYALKNNFFILEMELHK